MIGKPPPSAPSPHDVSHIFANPDFASMLQEQIFSILAHTLASLSSLAASIPQPEKPGVSHSSSGLVDNRT